MKISVNPDTACHTVPDSCVGALSSFNRSRFRAFCAKCGELRAAANVTDIAQHEPRADYSVILECTHTRMVSVAVTRTEAGREKLSRAKDREREFREHRELLDQMNSADTL